MNYTADGDKRSAVERQAVPDNSVPDQVEIAAFYSFADSLSDVAAAVDNFPRRLFDTFSVRLSAQVRLKDSDIGCSASEC